MTAIALIDAGTPAFICDSLQIARGKVTRAPENRQWIDLHYPPDHIHDAALVNKLLIHNGVGIAFSGNTEAIRNFADHYRDADLAGLDIEELAERILAMRNAPYL